MEKLQAVLKKYSLIQKITVGQGGADVYELAGRRILKHVCRKALPAEDIWEAYVKEACFYESASGKGYSWLPEMIAIEQNEHEILLLMKKYHMIAHEEVTNKMLEKILEVLASVHTVSASDFLKGRKRKPVFLSEDELTAAVVEWQKILEEHERKDETAMLHRIATKFNELNTIYFEPEMRLIHGDFHCNNLLLDEEGAVRICDWQNYTIGDGSEDVSFFISRLLADGFPLEERKLVEVYCAEMQKQGAACQPKVVEKKIALADLNASFVLWPAYLHNAPEERVQSIWDKMEQDMDMLLG